MREDIKPLVNSMGKDFFELQRIDGKLSEDYDVDQLFIEDGKEKSGIRSTLKLFMEKLPDDVA